MGETGNNFHGEWGLYNPLEIETKTFLEFGPLLEDAKNRLASLSAHHYSISPLKSIWLNRVLPEIFSHILLFINTTRHHPL